MKHGDRDGTSRSINLLILTLLSAASMPTLVHAQVASTSAPPIRTTLDDNGVDLSSGTLSAPIASVSIGRTGGVSHASVLRNGAFLETSVGYIRAGTGTVTVVNGTTSEVFNVSGTTFSPKEGTGSTLSLVGTIYTFTENDGSSAEFSTALPGAPNVANSWTRFDPAIALVTKTRDPDGTTRIFTYDSATLTAPGGRDGPRVGIAVRLRSIASNLGYNLIFRYQTDQIPTTQTGSSSVFWLTNVTAFNSKVDNCTATACTTTEVRPSLTISTPGSIPVTYTDALNRVTKFTAIAGSVTLRRPSSPTVDNFVATFNASNRVTSVVAGGVSTSYNYVDVATVRTVTVSRAAQPPRILTFDIASGMVKSDSDELGRKTTYTYNAQNQLTDILYPEGNKVRLTVDARANVTETRVISKTPGTPPDIVTGATYPISCTNLLSCNKPLTTTDAKGNVTNYEYDLSGMITKVTMPAASVGAHRLETRLGYTLAGTGAQTKLLSNTSTCQTFSSAQCIGTADELVNRVDAFDSNGRAATLSVQSGNVSLKATTALTYDALGNVLTADGPVPGAADTSRRRYDAVGQVMGVVSSDPDGSGPLQSRAQRYTYNVDGQVTLAETGTVTDQSDSAWTAFSAQQQEMTAYDVNARPVKQEVTSGGTKYAVAQTRYDALGRVDCVVQRMDPAQWATQTDACTPQTTSANGPDRVTKQTYDAVGRVIKTQTAVGTAAQADEVSTTYTANGQVASVADGEGNKTSYTYDGHDRLSETHYPDKVTKGVSAALDYEGYLYDANGNVTLRRTRDGSAFTYQYDALNRNTVKIVPERLGLAASATRDIYYGYDLRGLQTSARFDSLAGEGISTSYDVLGRVTSTTSNMGGVARVLAYQYDINSTRTRITHPDGVYFGYRYDTIGRMINADWTAPAVGTVPFMAITYDSLGRRTDINRASSYTGYSYDGVNRLTGQNQRFSLGVGNVASTFAYNPASQISQETRDNDGYAWRGAVNVNRSYATNGLNQYTNAGPATFSYDANGNLISDGTNSYTYDVENRMVSASNGATLAYDPLGRLWRTGGGAYGKTDFLYDGDEVVSEYDGDTGGMRRRYMWGANVDEPILWDEGGSMNCTGTRFLHTNAQGSVIALADCFGNLSQVNSYDEFGIPAAGNYTPALRQRFQYTGQSWIPELGMYYYKARIYSPTLGRFMQTDPIGYGDGMNWHNYVGGDPVNKSDPSGLCGGQGSDASTPCDGPLIVVTARRRCIFFCGGSGSGSSTTSAFGFSSFGGSRPPPLTIPRPAPQPAPTPQPVTVARQNSQPKPCNPTPAQLANSGAVTFRFSEGSATLLATSGDAFGTFKTAGGYSGVFRASFDGVFIGGKGFGAAYGTGSSKSLATFKGVNYNLIATLGPYSISDNFDPSSGAHVGQTDALSRIGMGLGGTRSDTTLVTISCPRGN